MVVPFIAGLSCCKKLSSNRAANIIAIGSVLLCMSSTTNQNNSTSSQSHHPTSRSEPQQKRNDNDIITSHYHHSGISPFLPIYIFQPNPNLEIAFDVRTRNPVYVLERLMIDDDSSTQRAQRRRRPRFVEETTLPEAFRSRNSYYHGSGYDRGHLAPAADFAWNAQAHADTFNLCNTSPQHASLNRGTWAYLEEWTRRVARRAHSANHASETWVVSGPLWMPNAKAHSDKDNLFYFSYPAIGRPPSLVSVPTHFFKVIVVVVPPAAGGDEKIVLPDDNGENDEMVITDFACFVIPNAPPPSLGYHHHDEPSLHDFVVPWTALEAVSGLQFFPKWTVSSRRLNAISRNSNSQQEAAEWKALADFLTTEQQQILGQQQSDKLLPLTNGGAAVEPTKRAKKIATHAASTQLAHHVKHLCRHGHCLRQKARNNKRGKK